SCLELMWGAPRDGWESLRILAPDSAAVVAWTDYAAKAEEVNAWLVARDALRGGDAAGSLSLAELGERTLDSATAAATIVPVHLRALSQMGRVTDAAA